ncbi:MAG: hypothetical protein IKI06_09320 [Prevotella sp.]|nr:hypothetical protein [Prevotella sp.]
MKAKLSEHLASPSEAALSQTNELDGFRLSPHFTLAELTKTSYHTLGGNIPSHVAIENLTRLCLWLEILRERYNRLYGDATREIPVVITSGYRSEEVNRLCGGAKGSNHLTGCAVDIRCAGPEQMIRYACILLDMADENGWELDELIQEKRGTTYWLHFAVRPSNNRRKILFDMR